jgi:predicted nuclease with RNAse H fold
MITLGIDLSSQPKNTAACRINWAKDGSAQVEAPSLECGDAKLDELIGDSEVIGIDAPFGWPLAFRAAVAGWTDDAWSDRFAFQESLRLRTTDRVARDKLNSYGIKQTPLSVSTDRIAMPAMRAMALLKRHGVTDKSGDGRFFEVYPAGTLACWKLPCRGYKNGLGAEDQRGIILAGIQRSFPRMYIPEVYISNNHALDALIAAISAKMAKDGDTAEPNQSELESARAEGWIHLPKSHSS